MRRPALSDETRDRLKQNQLARCRNPDLADVVERNIFTLMELREEFESSKTLQDRIADGINAFAGSMLFLYLHIGWFGFWVVANLGWLGTRPFDPFPFGLLTMVVSLEAIFLSTFILISQNRMQVIADQRADLDLQINLLSEYEITRVLTLVDAMADRMGINESRDPEIDELEKDVTPGVIVKEMEERRRDSHQSHDRGKP